MAAGFYIEQEGEELRVTEADVQNLEAADKIEGCDECSSTFSGRAVYHPTGDLTLRDIRREIDGPSE